MGFEWRGDRLQENERVEQSGKSERRTEQSVAVGSGSIHVHFRWQWILSTDLMSTGPHTKHHLLCSIIANEQVCTHSDRCSRCCTAHLQ